MRKIINGRPVKVVEGKRRLFSIEHANKSLVLVRRIVEDVIDSHQKLVDYQEILETAQRNDHGGEALRTRKAMMVVVEKIRRCLSEANQVGVEVRDWSLGIVDYPAMVGCKEIRLCWRYGEESIEFWHEVGECFAGRKEIAQLEELENLEYAAPTA